MAEIEKKCSCGKDATAMIYIKLTGDVVSYICEECKKERDSKMEEIRNSPEQIEFRKTLEDFRKLNNRKELIWNPELEEN